MHDTTDPADRAWQLIHDLDRDEAARLLATIALLSPAAVLTAAETMMRAEAAR